MTKTKRKPTKKAAGSKEDILKVMVKGYEKQVEELTVVFHKFIELARHPHGSEDHPHPQPWIVADRLDQEALYSIQEKLTGLLGEFGHLLGPFQEQQLLEKLPFLFKATEAAANG